jgi:opacity protein-like surface antigen
MRKITLIFLIGLMTVSFTSLKAQTENKIEIAPMVGYQFGGQVHYYEGDFKMDNAMNFGVNINFLVRQAHRVELTYSLMNTEGHFRPYSTFIGDFNSWDGDIAVHYITIASHSEYNINGGPVTLFGGIGLGTAILDIKHTSVSDIWRFSMSVTGGAKIAISDRIGIRLQGRLLMPMYFAGVGFYAGIGTGGASTGLSMNAGVVAFQGDFQGGLYFGF